MRFFRGLKSYDHLSKELQVNKRRNFERFLQKHKAWFLVLAVVLGFGSVPLLNQYLIKSKGITLVGLVLNQFGCIREPALVTQHVTMCMQAGTSQLRPVRRKVMEGEVVNSVLYFFFSQRCPEGRPNSLVPPAA